jgi:hypothetical protein
MGEKQESTEGKAGHKVFKRLYLANVVLIGLIIVGSAMAGLIAGDELLTLYLTFLALGPTLFFTLLLLSIWGAIRVPERRNVFILVGVTLALLIALTLNMLVNLTLP